MKFFLFIGSILLNSLLYGQSHILDYSKNWRLYDIMDENAFSYRLDTLENFSQIGLNTDTIKYFLEGLKELPDNQSQIWQGAYIATFDLNGKTNKIEISHYGGLLYDESRRKHYQISEYKIDDWLAFIRRSFISMRKS